MTPNEPDDQKNLESDTNDKPKSEEKNSDEEKSEEYLNFERGMKAILSLTPEEVEEVKKKTPFKKNGADN